MELVHEAQVDVSLINVVRDLFSDDPDNDVWDVYNRTEPSVQPYLEECMLFRHPKLRQFGANGKGDSGLKLGCENWLTTPALSRAQSTSALIGRCPRRAAARRGCSSSNPPLSSRSASV
jgi:hypothetical protein